MRKSLLALIVGLLVLMPLAGRAQDEREVVAMPPEVQKEMLIAMRDHLTVLDTILSHIASERYGEAAAMAEERLRASPFDPAKDAIFASYMTDEWKQDDAALRQAAQGLATAARALNTNRSYAASRQLAGAVSDVTTVCVGCHARNRLR